MHCYGVTMAAASARHRQGKFSVAPWMVLCTVLAQQDIKFVMHHVHVSGLHRLHGSAPSASLNAICLHIFRP
jgi:hypothetical protein